MNLCQQEDRVPHPRRVFIFAPRVGGHEPKPARSILN